MADAQLGAVDLSDAGDFESLAEVVGSLPSIPIARVRIRAAIQDAESSFDSMADLVAEDTAMAVAVMRLANSARFGLANRRVNLHEAVTRMGRLELRLVLDAVTAQVIFDGADDLNTAAVWRFSLEGAIASRRWAEKLGVPKSAIGDAYTAGLFRDVGRVRTEPAVARALGPGEQLPAEAGEWLALETRCVGYDHARLSAALVTAWNFPLSVIGAVLGHHAPGAETHALPAVVHLGDATASVAAEDRPASGPDTVAAPLREALPAFQLQWDEVLERTAHDVEDYGSSLLSAAA